MSQVLMPGAHELAGAAARAGVVPDQIEGLLLGQSLRRYTQQAWPQIVKDKLVWGWHMDAVCEHLEAVSAGQIEDLVINEPPGLSKSLQVSCFWQTWEWTRRPEGQWFFASYDDQLSTRDSIKCRNLILSEWYQRRWGHVFELADDQNLKTHYSNTKGGWRFATMVGGHGLGEHPDRIVIDDPHDRKRAFSEQQRRAAIEWWTQTISTRGIARGVRKVIIMQRLHEEDLTAEVLKEQGWVHLRLPMRFESARRCFTHWKAADGTTREFVDPRKVEGELLCPARYNEALVLKEEKRLGSFGTASQLQQRPSSAEGGIFKRKDWRFWFPAGTPLPPCTMHLVHACVVSDDGIHHIAGYLPPDFDDGLLSLDASMKDAMSQIRKGGLPDPVSMGAWARKDADYFMVDRKNGIMSVGDTASGFLALANAHPWARRKIIEDKANGPAVFQLLREYISGMILATPQGDKVERTLSTAGADRRDKDARAMSLQAIHEGGNMWIPAPGVLPGFDPWAFIETFASFPAVIHDDDVDMTSQAILYLQPRLKSEARQAHSEALQFGAPLETTKQLFDKRRKDMLERALGIGQPARGSGNPYARRR